LVKKLFMG